MISKILKSLIFKMLEAEKRDQAISIVTRSILHDNKGEEEIKEYPDALLWWFKLSQ
ncbi:MAG: hypothetical protein QOK89_06715 [Nitrososphaeraceae archaeon]|nr:hypothetical protein [Nitrososphaeraceae archaeon]